MGVSLPTQDEEIKVEMDSIRCKLNGPNSHKLKCIRENVEKNGSGSHIISFRQARDKAAGYAWESLRAVDPRVREDKMDQAVDTILRLIIENPVFAEYA